LADRDRQVDRQRCYGLEQIFSISVQEAILVQCQFILIDSLATKGKTARPTAERRGDASGREQSNAASYAGACEANAQPTYEAPGAGPGSLTHAFGQQTGLQRESRSDIHAETRTTRNPNGDGAAPADGGRVARAQQRPFVQTGRFRQLEQRPQSRRPEKQV
jgi:hypothetical protein